jgi:GGDEF domain-containing protein
VVAQAARGFPLAVSIGAALLAWRLHRSRLMTAAFALVAAQVLLHVDGLGRQPLAHALLVTFLPLGIALLSFPSERGIKLTTIRNHIGLAFGPLAAAAFFSAGNTSGATELLMSDVIHPVYTDWSRLPQLAFFGAVLSLVLLGVSTWRSRRPSEAGLLWLTLALIAAFASPAGSTPRGIWMLAAALALLVALVETAYALAFHDELTGLPGRRALAQLLGSLSPPYSIAVIDIDHFKSFNDRYGHDVGDQVLRMVAARLAAVGGTGKAFRAGGEEFTIVFPRLGKSEALAHVEELRAAVESAEFTLRTLPRPSGKEGSARRGRKPKAAPRLQVTFSAGVAAASANSSVDSVLKAADKAMYRAKEEGRNRVVASGASRSRREN